MISERVTAEPVFNCLISNWLYSTALTQHLFPSKVEDTCIVKQSNYLLFISTSTLLVARVGVGRHMPVPKGATDDLETTDRPPDSYLSRSFNTKPDYTVIGRALIYSTTSPQRWNFSSPDCLTMKNLTPPSFFFFFNIDAMFSFGFIIHYLMQSDSQTMPVIQRTWADMGLYRTLKKENKKKRLNFRSARSARMWFWAMAEQCENSVLQSEK